MASEKGPLAVTAMPICYHYKVNTKTCIYVNVFFSTNKLPFHNNKMLCGKLGKLYMNKTSNIY